MGVRGLWKILEQCYTLEIPENKRLAIDASMWLHKYKNIPHSSIVYYFLKRILGLMYCQNILYFVFDTKSPDEKIQTVIKRSEQRLKNEINMHYNKIINNKTCKKCRMLYKECKHGREISMSEIKEIEELVNYQLRNHDLDWGDELSDDRLSDFDVAATCEEPNELYLDKFNKKSNHEFDKYLKDNMLAVNFDKLSKTKKLLVLGKLKELNAFTTCSMANISDKEFSEFQLEKTKRAHAINDLINQISSSKKRRIMSDCKSYYELNRGNKNDRYQYLVGKSAPLLPKKTICAGNTNKNEKDHDSRIYNGFIAEIDSIFDYTDEKDQELTNKKAKMPVNLTDIETTPRSISCTSKDENTGAVKVQSHKDKHELQDKTQKMIYLEVNTEEKNSGMLSQKSNVPVTTVKDSDCKLSSETIYDEHDSNTEIYSNVVADNILQLNINEYIHIKTEHLKKNIMLRRTNIMDEIQKLSLLLKKILRLLGIPCIDAPYEADSQLGYLNCSERSNMQVGKKNSQNKEILSLTDNYVFNGTIYNLKVDAIITDDNDVFLFGADKVYRNFFGGSRLYTMDNIIKKINLKRDDLIKLSVFLGNDYTVGFQGIGPKKALEILQGESRIEYDKKIFEDEYDKMKKIYYNAVIDVKPLRDQRGFDMEKIRNFMVTNGLETRQIDELFLYLNKIQANCKHIDNRDF